MKINHETVERIAELARLDYSGEAADEIMNDMNKMLDFVDKLKELDTEGVEPLIFMTEETNVLRTDEVEAEITQAEALSNAPKKDMYYFRVPKVIKQQ
ncbi:MAG: Asp-tRNA(Asn)/Glu-tRNA(Gln) amidotransferase subunit GatC [Crocinitomicaceae bacterium]|nr:Asp-tRNA(Asn)/Glu-tRNA(Gln) amidotransferase subunit GatC [Crocinitomicaceae bacterium]